MNNKLLGQLLLVSCIFIGCVSSPTDLQQEKSSDGAIADDSPSNQSAEVEVEAPEDGGTTGESKVEPSEDSLVVEKETINYQPFLQALKQGQRQLIEAEAARILAEHPEDLMVLNSLARFHRLAGRRKLSAVFIQRILKIQTYNLQALQNMAMIHWQNGEPGKALSEWHKIEQRDSDFPGVKYNLAMSYFNAGVYDKAEELLEPLFKQQSLAEISGAEIVAAYAQVLAEKGKVDAALDIFIQTLQMQRADILQGSNGGRAIIGGLLRIFERFPQKMKGREDHLNPLVRLSNDQLAARAKKLLGQGGAVGKSN